LNGEFCTQFHYGCVRREQTSALSRCLNTRQVTAPPCIALHAWHHRLFRTNYLHEQLILVLISIENPILSSGATNSIPGREESLKGAAKRLRRPPIILAETADEGAKHIVNMYKLQPVSNHPSEQRTYFHPPRGHHSKKGPTHTRPNTPSIPLPPPQRAPARVAIL
jgi:hypothetical protein